MRKTRIGAGILALTLSLSGCAEDGTEAVTETAAEPSANATLQQAQQVNRARHVAERFEEHPVVIDDSRGFATAELFFDTSEVLILSDETPQSVLRAASLAVVAHAPMVIYSDDQHQEVIREIERLKAHTIYAVGDVPVLNYTEKLEVIRDPGGAEALENATALKFTDARVADPAEAAAAVAGLDPSDPVWLRPDYGEPQHIPDDAEGGVVPLQSRIDAEMAPIVVATPESSRPGIANARAFGASVYVVGNPDPRHDEETLLVMAGLFDRPLIALGSQFGSGQQLADRIREAEEAVGPNDLDHIETLPQSAD